jgi:hypothetical protein
VTNSKGDHLETEQKYDADADFVLPELGSLPDLGGRRATEPRRIYLSATYFDTEDQRLIRHKVTLRRRVGGDDEGWHLKLPAGKDTRQEVHAPLGEGNTGSAPARLTEQIEEITAGEQLRPVALLDTERTVVTLAGPSGDALVEVADDLVTAVRFGGSRCSRPVTRRRPCSRRSARCCARPAPGRRPRGRSWLGSWAPAELLQRPGRRSSELILRFS